MDCTIYVAKTKALICCAVTTLCFPACKKQVFSWLSSYYQGMEQDKFSSDCTDALADLLFFVDDTFSH